MPDRQSSPTNPSSTRSDNRARFAFWIRVVAFMIVVIGCGWYSRFLQSMWTNLFPLICADGNMALFAVDFDAFPARLGDQNNSCSGISDGECRRKAGDEMIHGECRNGHMHGAWSLVNVKTGTTSWSGMYADGLPRGEFHNRLDDNHENVFRVENLQVHGSTRIWERQGNRFVEVSGQYHHGKRTGRWVRRVEPSPALLSASVYDDNGFLTTTSFYCTNGNRKEIRGGNVFLFDPQGNLLAKSLPNDENANDASLCPLP